jgi:hypothetical protein
MVLRGFTPERACRPATLHPAPPPQLHTMIPIIQSHHHAGVIDVSVLPSAAVRRRAHSAFARPLDTPRAPGPPVPGPTPTPALEGAPECAPRSSDDQSGRGDYAPGARRVEVVDCRTHRCTVTERKVRSTGLLETPPTTCGGHAGRSDEFDAHSTGTGAGCRRRRCPEPRRRPPLAERRKPCTRLTPRRPHHDESPPWVGAHSAKLIAERPPQTATIERPIGSPISRTIPGIGHPPSRPEARGTSSHQPGWLTAPAAERSAPTTP